MPVILFFISSNFGTVKCTIVQLSFYWRKPSRYKTDELDMYC